ncbi:MAG: Gfo/Idh/MocA family oxidoreductase [Candidatus Glassbacteria bacterium]|nr:Gfo/Idh/MocA family oxidoreductase [Candidatus Glassbacteria bacterium]
MSRTTKKLTAALVGTGRIGWMLEHDPLRGGTCTHAGAMTATGRVSLVAGADLDEKRLRAFGEAYEVDSLYPDHRALLDKHRVDILSVAAPAEAHCAIVTEAAASGRVRGIYCEKPVCHTLGEADRMIEACDKAGVALLIGHERRFGAHFMRARELVHDGIIGEVRTVIGQALSGDPGSVLRSMSGGGPLMHDGTHLTDLLGYFLGSADWVIGMTRRAHGPARVEHTASGMVGFPSGAVAFIEGGGRRKYFAFELELQGSEGVIGVGNSPPGLWLAESSRRFSGFNELAKAKFPEYTPNNGFVAAFEALIEEIETGMPSLSTGRDGREALQIILALYESAAKGGRRVRLH